MLVPALEENMSREVSMNHRLAFVVVFVLVLGTVVGSGCHSRQQEQTPQQPLEDLKKEKAVLQCKVLVSACEA